MSDDVEKLIERLEERHSDTYRGREGQFVTLWSEAAAALRDQREENDELNRIKNELLGDCHTYVIENAKLRARAEKAEAENKQLRMRLDWYCKEYSRHVIVPALKGEPYDIYQQGRKDGAREALDK
jgi:hypothetical protein